MIVRFEKDLVLEGLSGVIRQPVNDEEMIAAVDLDFSTSEDLDRYDEYFDINIREMIKAYFELNGESYEIEIKADKPTKTAYKRAIDEYFKTLDGAKPEKLSIVFEE